jgi:hypothetical protein
MHMHSRFHSCSLLLCCYTHFNTKKDLYFAQQINIQECSKGKGKGIIKTETEELSFQFFYQTIKDMMLVLAIG